MATASKKKAAKKKTTRSKATAKKAGGKKKVAKKAAGSEVPVRTETTRPTIQDRAVARIEDLENVFDDLIRRRWPRPLRWEWPRWESFPSLFEDKVPSVDVIDREKEVIVRAEVPGIEKEDLDISITDRTLTIKGSTRKEEQEEQDDYFRHEIRSGTFSRSVLLPSEINASKAAASFKDGVVELNLPKVRAAKRQTISVD
ncbi:MAG: Hsp20/alpha crystallin family protein [Gammaproteobacteria bacterium]|jgi:HSP20 family protein